MRDGHHLIMPGFLSLCALLALTTRAGDAAVTRDVRPALRVSATRGHGALTGDTLRARHLPARAQCLAPQHTKPEQGTDACAAPAVTRIPFTGAMSACRTRHGHAGRPVARAYAEFPRPPTVTPPA